MHCNFTLSNVSVKSKLQHPPPGHTPGIWHLCRPREEGIWSSESSRGWGIWPPCLGGGEFERSLDFMWNLWLLRTWRASDHGGLVRRFQRERLSLCGELVAKKGIKQTLCSFWRYLNFDICNIGFRLWIYEGIKLCLQWNTIPNYVSDSIQYNNKKLNRGQLLWPAAFMFINKVSDDACLWNGHKYRIYGM